MNLSKNANSRLWDALLKELLIENMNMQVADLSGNDAPMPSESFEKNISKIARSVGRKEAARNVAKLMKNGTITLAVVLSITFCMLLTQPKVYAAVSDVIKTAISGGFDKYTFSGDNAEFDSTVRLGYVPQNYELRNAEFSGNAYASLIYVNIADEAKGKDEADEIKLDYGISASTSFSIDNERHECKEISKSGTVYHLYIAKEEDDWSSIIWQKNGYAFCIDAHFDADELVKIAENVEF